MIVLHSAAQIATPLNSGDFQILNDAAIAYDKETIKFVGPSKEALDQFRKAKKINVAGKVLIPGFVDSHTHLIFGGDRSQEFLMRLRGATYQEIAAFGGGILHTMRETRAGSPDELAEKALGNLKLMLKNGTTTVEVKSGYGLGWEHERKLLKITEALKKQTSIDLVSTFLGAHDFPPEVSCENYVRQVIDEMLPQVAEEKLAEFCDVFCDQGYYSIEQTREISNRAKQLGLKIKLHVDELADVGGAALAAELKAVSADHLIFANDDGIRKMAEAKVCAVLLPGTSIGLKSGKHAPARRMVESGVRVALATDFNPGTCYSHSMLFMMQLGALLYRLNAEETLTAATLNAATAIDRADQIGSLEPGKQMDCLVFDIPHYGYLFYNLGVNHLETVFKRGKVAWNKNQKQG
ncbi:imidazolonepropionase [bacterium]|nr:imidazolonepropionase [bacterium]